jgi:15-cis-phytoene synthase
MAGRSRRFEERQAAVTEKQLSMAYTVCRGIARAQAKNFYYAFLILPKPKRDALCAVYAFMRHADDLSDDPGLSPEQRQMHLHAWASALHSAVEGNPGDDPVVMAVADAQRRYNIPLELFDQLVYGTTMDLQFEGAAQNPVPFVPYKTFADLYQYCYHVASVVGLVCLYIFGFKDERAKKLAEQTGIAFQLTNIIRDVKEDARMGRVYLPEEDLLQFGKTSADLAPARFANGVTASEFSPLLEFEAQRAREYYRSGDELIMLISEDSRPCLWALVEIYRRLLDKITARQYDVFKEKVRLSTPEKLSVLSRGLVKAVL